MIYKIHKKNNYTVIDNDILKNKDLSLKAKGMLCLLLSLPESWEYSEVGIENIVKESRDSVRTILKELEDLHYLVRTRVRNEKGQVKKTKYDIYEKPMLEKPMLEKPTLDLQTQLNKDISNKEILNKEIIKEKYKKEYFKDEELNSLFNEFLNMRKKLKAINSDLAISKLLKILQGLDKESQKRMIEQSIINSWKSLYPLKNKIEPEWMNKEIELKENKNIEELFKDL